MNSIAVTKISILSSLELERLPSGSVLRAPVEGSEAKLLMPIAFSFLLFNLIQISFKFKWFFPLIPVWNIIFVAQIHARRRRVLFKIAASLHKHWL